MIAKKAYSNGKVRLRNSSMVDKGKDSLASHVIKIKKKWELESWITLPFVIMLKGLEVRLRSG